MEMNKPLLHSEITLLLYTWEKPRSAIMKVGRSEAQRRQRGEITTLPRLMEDLDIYAT